jgi:hypothetical protein
MRPKVYTKDQGYFLEPQNCFWGGFFLLSMLYN